jgi:MarR family transcriptional regulator, organic hydroperoxide resistance regulator
MRARDAEDVLGPGLDFLRELWALDHALQKLSKRMERTLGVSGPQRLALRLVGRFPGLPAGRLARLLHLHPSTVSGLVRRLVDRGLIARSSEGPDRRRAELRITPAGIDLLARPESNIESAVWSALGGLPPRKVQAALKVLASVSMRLTAARETAGTQ